jgi:hypothetical protein
MNMLVVTKLNFCLELLCIDNSSLISSPRIQVTLLHRLQ